VSRNPALGWRRRLAEGAHRDADRRQKLSLSDELPAIREDQGRCD